MKTYLKYFAIPLLIAVVASALCIVDAFIGGLGIGLSPIASTSDAVLMFGIIITYSVLGLICGFVSITCQNKIKEKLENLQKN